MQPAIDTFTVAESQLRQAAFSAEAIYSRYKILNLASDDLVPAPPLEQLLAALAPLHGVAADSYRVLVLVGLSAWDKRQGNYQPAREHYRQAIQIMNTCQCAWGQGFRVSDGMALLELSLGRPAAALQDLQAAKLYLHRSGVKTYSRELLMHEARTNTDLHFYRRAVALYEQALRGVTDEDYDVYPFLESNLGTLYLRFGEKSHGLSLLQKRAAARTAGDGKCVLLGNLGNRYTEVGDLSHAEEALSSALENCRTAAASELLAETYALRARVRLDGTTSQAPSKR